MYRVAAGIKPCEEHPAYERFEIAPIPDRRLGYVKARIDTRHGEIVSEWRYEGDRVRYAFEIPDGAVAVVTVDGVSRKYNAGKYTVWG